MKAALVNLRDVFQNNLTKAKPLKMFICITFPSDLGFLSSGAYVLVDVSLKARKPGTTHT